MPTAQDYQHRAAECLRLARGTRNPTNKALFLEMALTWVKLSRAESWAAVAQGGSP
ncbi:MAG TPA: hypothetical protein VKB89_20965 [Xanthobacteraceae bacterium]|nr:hypothetical protein [Xanthobacteraceae bacterium]